MLLLLLHYSSTCSDNNSSYICIKMQTPLLILLHCGNTNRPQTNLDLPLSVVQFWMHCFRQSGSGAARSWKRVKDGGQNNCHVHYWLSSQCWKSCWTRQQWCFITTTHLSFFSFGSIGWYSVLVTIVLCSKPEGTFHSCHQVVKDIEGGLSLWPSAHPHLLQEHCLPGHSGVER